MIIHEDNVIDGLIEQFHLCPTEYCTVQDLPYDYESVMHYDSHAFAKGSEPTITKLDGSIEFGQRNGFSELDIKGINRYYCGEFTF